MPRRYPVEFRRKVLDLIEAGKPVAEIAAQLGITALTVYKWRNQDQIDHGVRTGTSAATAATQRTSSQRPHSQPQPVSGWASVPELDSAMVVTRPVHRSTDVFQIDARPYPGVVDR